MKEKILKNIRAFATEISKGIIEIYNEASIQYELAIYLRKRLENKYKIQLERNIEYFGISKSEKKKIKKKEMDIVIYTPDKKEKYCIELKFPTNGQHPEQMFSACKDVKFIEQLKGANFNGGFFVMFAEDPLFYNAKGADGIYKMFRNEKIIKGLVKKPTGKQDEIISFDGQYKLQWKDLNDKLKYFVIEV